MKHYILFLKIEDGSWYGWKRYASPEIAIRAFEDIRKSWEFDHFWKIGDVAKIVGNGAVTFYKTKYTLTKHPELLN